MECIFSVALFWKLQHVSVFSNSVRAFSVKDCYIICFNRCRAGEMLLVYASHHWSSILCVIFMLHKKYVLFLVDSQCIVGLSLWWKAKIEDIHSFDLNIVTWSLLHSWHFLLQAPQVCTRRTCTIMLNVLEKLSTASFLREIFVSRKDTVLVNVNVFQIAIFISPFLSFFCVKVRFHLISGSTNSTTICSVLF